jgi:putative membrane protein
MTQTDYEKKYKKLIIVLSVAIPVAVGALFRVKIEGVDTRFLPAVYATINGITAVVLIFSLLAIKNKKIKLHQQLNTFALLLSTAFLVMYVTYHMTTPETPYGGNAPMKYVYYVVLTSHILLSMIIVPFVLFTYVRGWSMKVEAHKKLARITYPMWMYVAVSGVVVYIMLSPYYK